MSKSVDLVLNCYEKTYKKLLRQEYINSIVVQNSFEFTNVIVIVSNVDDRGVLEEILSNLQSSNTITKYYFVDDYLNETLKKLGISMESLGKIKHYSTWAFVMAEVVKSEFFVHWDTDISLSQSVDWITPSIKLFDKVSNLFITNPNWDNQEDQVKAESCESDDDFYYGYGISDQLFMGKSGDFKGSIYNEKHIYSLRYPMSHIAPIYEMRIDSYMRNHKKIRATYRGVSYHHPLEKTAIYPKGSIWEYVVLKKVYRNIIKVYKKFITPCDGFEKVQNED